MPKGVYRKKNKKGVFMHFRDGKIISKKSYNASKRSKGTRKGQVRKTARRAFTPKRKNKGSKRMARKRTMPHPSLSGLASGALVFSWLNSKSGWTRRVEGKESVTSWLAKGDINKATMRFLENAKTMFKPDQGLKTVGSAVVIATAGAIARKQLGNPKVGGSKIYARL